MICPWNERRVVLKHSRRCRSENIANCVYTDTRNNYKIRRGLLVGFVMYRVRGSFAERRVVEKRSRGETIRLL